MKLVETAFYIYMYRSFVCTIHLLYVYTCNKQYYKKILITYFFLNTIINVQLIIIIYMYVQQFALPFTLLTAFNQAVQSLHQNHQTACHGKMNML